MWDGRVGDSFYSAGEPSSFFVVPLKKVHGNISRNFEVGRIEFLVCDVESIRRRRYSSSQGFIVREDLQSPCILSSLVSFHHFHNRNQRVLRTELAQGFLKVDLQTEFLINKNEANFSNFPLPYECAESLSESSAYPRLEDHHPSTKLQHPDVARISRYSRVYPCQCRRLVLFSSEAFVTMSRGCSN
ncbi:hypothetical protein V1477_002443 [Vespula maculifrons]|uniref:Uncharacterized protein n=1 Tax=Vespula maculifrons TaxID=7453 RepID=A0ABD2CWH7_VESMC